MSGGARRAGVRGLRRRRRNLNVTGPPPPHPAPNSCLTTEWGEWDECSATCGMGMKKRHRMVKMSPADGSMCKAETTQAEKCMMPECREWVWGRGGGNTEGHSILQYYHLGRMPGGAGGRAGPVSLQAVLGAK